VEAHARRANQEPSSRNAALAGELAEQHQIVEAHISELEQIIGPRPQQRPDWLLEVVKHDAQTLAQALYQTDLSPQNGHVFLRLDKTEENHQPYVLFSFRYINWSVYTLLLDSLTGKVFADHQEIMGNFAWDKPVEIARQAPVRLNLRFLVTSDASVGYLKELTAKEQIYFGLDFVRLTLKAKEDSEVPPTDMRFSPQYWRKQDVSDYPDF
jgi:hypothetical protein